MHRYLKLLVGTAGIAPALFASQAYAQTADTPPPPAAAPMQTAAAQPTESTLGDIVVTARRREESLQRVPTAITAFSQKTLTEKSISSAVDLGKSVPGLSVNADSGSPGLPAFSIRGRGQVYGAAAGSVETYFADVPLSAPFQMPTLPAQFFDLQSLQVLKGPQGTLFGRSTTGGAVLLVPQAPTNKYEGYLRLQGGTYGDFQAEGAVNIPLGDLGGLRIAGFDWQRNGYMHTTGGLPDALTGKILPSQDYSNQDTKELRGTLLLKPFDGFTNSTILTWHYDKQRNSSSAGLNRNFGTRAAPFSIVAGSTYNPGLDVFYSPGYGTRYTPLSVNLNKPATRVWAAVNTTTYEATDSLTIKNIFGYIHSKGFTNDGSDADGTTLFYVDLPTPTRPRVNKQLTDELQLQGHAFADRLTWVVGGLIDRTREPGGSTSINVVSFLPDAPSTVGAPVALFSTRFQQNRLNTEGVFGSLTFKITDSLIATGGYRHSWDDVTAIQGGIGAGPPDNVAPPSILSKLHTKFQGDTYNASLEYHLDAKTMAYGGFRHGYKRGGFNSSIFDPRFANFQPETVNDFYLGAKTDFHVGGAPARFNIEGYYDKYKGQQVGFVTLDPNGSLIEPTINIPKTRYLGFDMDFVIDPIKWLSLSGAYSFITAKNTYWPDTTIVGQTGDLTDNPVIYTPRHKFSLSSRFHAPVGEDKGELVFVPTLNYQAKQYNVPFSKHLPNAGQLALGGPYDAAAHGGDTIPGYSTVDLHLGWEHVIGSRFDVAANVTNLTNKYYWLGNGATLAAAGVEGWAAGPPRMMTFEVTAHF